MKVVIPVQISDRQIRVEGQVDQAFFQVKIDDNSYSVGYTGGDKQEDVEAIALVLHNVAEEKFQELRQIYQRRDEVIPFSRFVSSLTSNGRFLNQVKLEEGEDGQILHVRIRGTGFYIEFSEEEGVEDGGMEQIIKLIEDTSQDNLSRILTKILNERGPFSFNQFLEFCVQKLSIQEGKVGDFKAK